MTGIKRKYIHHGYPKSKRVKRGGKARAPRISGLVRRTLFRRRRDDSQVCHITRELPKQHFDSYGNLQTNNAINMATIWSPATAKASAKYWDRFSVLSVKFLFSFDEVMHTGPEVVTKIASAYDPDLSNQAASFGEVLKFNTSKCRIMKPLQSYSFAYRPKWLTKIGTLGSLLELTTDRQQWFDCKNMQDVDFVQNGQLITFKGRAGLIVNVQLRAVVKFKNCKPAMMYTPGEDVRDADLPDLTETVYRNGHYEDVEMSPAVSIADATANAESVASFPWGPTATAN